MGVGILVRRCRRRYCGGAVVLREFIAGEADPELKLPTQIQAATTDVDGTWTVAPNKDDDAKRAQAGYRVDEVLQGFTAHGERTNTAGDR